MLIEITMAGRFPKTIPWFFWRASKSGATLRFEGLLSDLSVEKGLTPAGAVFFSSFTSATRAVRSQGELGWRLESGGHQLRPYLRVGVRYEDSDGAGEGMSGEFAILSLPKMVVS